MPDEESLLDLLGGLGAGEPSLLKKLENLGAESPEKSEEQGSDGSLRSRLITVARNFIARIKEREIVYKNIPNYIHEQLLEQKIIISDGSLGTMIKNDEIAGEVGTYLKNNLPVKAVRGIRDDYGVLDSTPISEEAQKDIEEYQALKVKVDEYLKQFERKPIARAFKEFVYSIFPDHLKDDTKSKVYHKLSSDYEIKTVPDDKTNALQEKIQRELKGIDLEKEVGDS